MTAAAGPRAKAEEALRNTIADSATFRTWTGTTGNQAAARNRIYYDRVPPPDNKDEYTREELRMLRPFVILSHRADEDGHVLEQTSTSTYTSHGIIELTFEEDVPDELIHTPKEMIQAFKNRLDMITQEVWALTHPPRAGYLALVKTVTEGNPREASFKSEAREGMCLQQDIQVHY